MIINLVTILSSLLIFTHDGPQYIVQSTIDTLEFRDYQPWIVAETIVKGTHDTTGNQAFHILAGYIFGSNDQKTKIQMTAPVNMQEISQGQFLVQFFMPQEWTLDTLPKPNDSRITLKTLPDRRVVAFRYHGNWSDELYKEELQTFTTKLTKLGIQPKNQPIWARYNSPMTQEFQEQTRLFLKYEIQ